MTKNTILGVLYGMAIGDALGMPPEFWSRSQIKQRYQYIDDFLEGHPDNEISFQYSKGQITDDTAQAIEILNSLITTQFKVNSQHIAQSILNWAKREDAFNQNILGPTSKLTLELFEQGKDTQHISNKATTNGSAMRIAPIGTLFLSHQKTELCNYVYQISKVTHSSDVAIAGACMIAMAVSSIFDKKDKDIMIQDILAIEDYALSLGHHTTSPRLSTRIQYAIKLAQTHEHDESKFLDELYNMFAGSVQIVDSVPCAIAIAYYAFDVKRASILAANLGGDTDTIGSMAAAICGAIHGIDAIDTQDIHLINTVNHIDFNKYADYLTKYRGTLS